MGTTTSIQKTVTLTDPVNNKRNLIVAVTINGQKDHESIIPIEDLSDNYKKYIDEINMINTPNHSLVLPFCLIDGVSTIDNCKFVLNLSPNSDINQKFSIEKSNEECYTPLFRRGNIIFDKDLFISELGEGLIMHGYKAKIKYVDYDYNDSILENCCLKKQSTCNSFLINDYKTTHCNPIMSTYCQTNPNSKECITWLENSSIRIDTIALELYKDLCSSDMSQPYCEYFCIIANTVGNSNSSLCDEALTTYCTNNKGDNKCDCFNFNIPEGEYYGAKECWLPSCVEQESRWLTSLQQKKRSECNVINCSVSIDKIKNNSYSKIDIINDCINTNKIESSVITNTNDDNSETRFNIFPFDVFFLNIPMTIIVLFTIIYSIVVIAKINKKHKHKDVDGILKGN